MPRNPCAIAIEIARDQQAKLLEVRVTTSLDASSWVRVDRPRRLRCSPTFTSGFTEGFDIANLKDVKALLDELST